MTITSGKRVLWQGDVTISNTVATVDKILP